jgi:hypothetical protein
MNVRVTFAAFLGLGCLTGCADSGQVEPVAAQVETKASDSSPPMKCKYHQVGFFDFPVGPGQDSVESVADPYRAPESTLVVDKGRTGATIYVISASGEATLTIIDAINEGKGWHANKVESCDDSPHLAPR